MEFLVIGLMVPLLIMILALNGLGFQRHKMACQAFAWQALRQVSLHTDESLSAIEWRLHSLAIQEETTFKINPGDLKFSIAGEIKSGQVVTVTARLNRSQASASMRL